MDAAEGSHEIEATGRLEPYANVECGTEAAHYGWVSVLLSRSTSVWYLGIV